MAGLLGDFTLADLYNTIDRYKRNIAGGVGLRPEAVIRDGLLAYPPAIPLVSVMATPDEKRRGQEQMAMSGLGLLSIGNSMSPLYHGSKHKFNKFDLRKIGTGEGAQEYGRGLYFAEDEKAAQWLAELPGGTPNMYETRLRWPDVSREANDPLGPHHFLDWDKPLAEHSDYVRQAVEPSLSLDFVRRVEKRPAGKVRGSDVYGEYTRMFGGEDQASEALRKVGIPGIRYIDPRVLDTAEESANYVIFDDALAEVLRRNGLPVR